MSTKENLIIFSCSFSAEKFVTLSLNKQDIQQILGLSYLEIEFKFGEDSPIKTLASNITSRTMFSELVMISDDALKEAIGDGPDNGCTYLEKMGGRRSGLTLLIKLTIFCTI